MTAPFYYLIFRHARKLVIAVVNFPPKQIANFQSEVLTLGLADKNRKNHWIIIQPEREVELGLRIE